MFSFLTKVALIVLFMVAIVDINRDKAKEDLCIKVRSSQVWLNTDWISNGMICFQVNSRFVR